MVAKNLIPVEGLYGLYRRMNVKYFEDKLPVDVKIEWSKRLTSSAGNCSRFKSGHQCPVIRLSVWYHLQQPPQETVQTLLHEMIHLVAKGHGKGFQNHMQRIKNLGGCVECYAKDWA